MWMGHWCNEGHSWQKESSGLGTLACGFILLLLRMFCIKWLYEKYVFALDNLVSIFWSKSKYFGSWNFKNH